MLEWKLFQRPEVESPLPQRLPSSAEFQIQRLTSCDLFGTEVEEAVDVTMSMSPTEVDPSSQYFFCISAMKRCTRHANVNQSVPTVNLDFSRFV